MGIFNFKKKKVESEVKEERKLVVQRDDEAMTAEEQASYRKRIGDEYVAKRHLDLTDEELQGMSITDGAEMWELFSWFKKNIAPDKSQEEAECSRLKVNKVADSLIKKILQIDEIYCLYNKKTGEPHLFSRTHKQKEGYMTTPPDIRIFTKAYADYMMSKYPDSIFEMRKIENGEDRKGIENFLGKCFYLNGAQGIEIHSEQVAIDAGMIVSPPDFEDVPEINVPIMNPDLMRWMLLMAQMGEAKSDDEKLIYNLYYQFMTKEIVKAKLLVPMKLKEEMPEPDEEGKVTLDKDSSFMFASIKGKKERDAFAMFTDWNRLNDRYKGWKGSIMTLESVMEIADVAINLTSYPELGFYVGKEMFEEMQKSADA